jgi:predicted MFS family arabinose efflux permease
MSFCVAMLIAAEFMPVSLLTPIARDLAASDGMAGQAISISGLFAVLSSLLIVNLAGRFDRKPVLLSLTGLMLASLILTAQAPNFTILMIARSLLGVAIGGFWALATATVIRLVAAQSVASALGTMYMGNAVATAFAAPIGSYLGGLIGWRGVFWLLVPFVVLTLIWQWICLPSMPAQATATGSPLALLRRRNIRFATPAVMLSFAGAFAAFTYFRPFLENVTRLPLPQLSLALFALGLASFIGTAAASRLLKKHLYRLLALLPLALALITLLLLNIGALFWPTVLALVAWGVIYSAIPVCWSAWISDGIHDQPESGGGLIVALIQLAILLGGSLGGALLDHLSIAATFMGAAVLLLLAALIVGNGSRVMPAARAH